MPTRSLTTIRPRIWIPPTEGQIYKVEIETSEDTYDITDIIIEAECTDGVTNTIGNFKILFDNSAQTYSNLLNLYDHVNIYLDYGSSATTRRFRGVIEKRSYRRNNIEIMGRSMAARATGLTVTKSYTNQYTHDIVQDILDTSATYITQNNIDTTEGTDTQVTISFYEKPFWECIIELCNRAGYDAYIDDDSDFHYYVADTRDNTTEAVVHESNLIETGDFAPDLSVVKNKVVVYGAKVEDMQIVWTESDSASITAYDEKKLIISDSNIRTIGEAQSRAQYELSINKDPPIVGEVKSLGLPTIAPGERIRISDPLNGLDPDYYTIQKYTHKFSNDEPFQTELTVQKETRTIPNILKQRISFEKEVSERENPNDMEYSWVFDFDTDSGVHSSTEIVGGVLKLQSGQSSGTWISDLNLIDANMSSFEIRAKGEGFATILYSEDSTNGTRYYVSANNGVDWTEITAFKTSYDLVGRYIKIKVEINNSDTQIDSLALLYK